MKSIVRQSIVVMVITSCLCSSVFAETLNKHFAIAMMACIEGNGCVVKSDDKLSDEAPPLAKYKSKVAKRDDKTREKLPQLGSTFGKA